jgi:hypothetical protein
MTDLSFSLPSAPLKTRLAYSHYANAGEYLFDLGSR